MGAGAPPRPSPVVPAATACTCGCGADLSVPLGPSRKVTSPRNGSERCSRTPPKAAGAPAAGGAAHLAVPYASRHSGQRVEIVVPKATAPSLSAGRAGRGSQATVSPLCGTRRLPSAKCRPEKEVAAPLLLLETPWKRAATTLGLAAPRFPYKLLQGPGGSSPGKHSPAREWVTLAKPNWDLSCTEGGTAHVSSG